MQIWPHIKCKIYILYLKCCIFLDRLFGIENVQIVDWDVDSKLALLMIWNVYIPYIMNMLMDFYFYMRFTLLLLIHDHSLG